MNEKIYRVTGMVPDGRDHNPGWMFFVEFVSALSQNQARLRLLRLKEYVNTGAIIQNVRLSDQSEVDAGWKKTVRT